MRTVIMLFALLSFSTVTNAQDKKVETVTFEVDGVCGMCKDRIENAVNLTKGVKSSEWNKESHQLTVTYQTKKTSPEQIGEALAEVGHDNEYVKASDKEYGKIHKCCRYREMESH